MCVCVCVCVCVRARLHHYLITSRYQHGFPDPLSVRPYHSLPPAGLPNYIMGPHRTLSK